MGNNVTCLLGILMVVLWMFWVMNRKYAVLFFLQMDSCCLGLHDKNMRCEVVTFQNYCYALVSCQIFLLTDHAVGTETNCVWDSGGDFCTRRDLLPFFFSFALALQDTGPLLPCSKPKHWATDYGRVFKGSFLLCSLFLLAFY